MFKSVNRRGEGVAPLPRRGKNDTGEGQGICNIYIEKALQPRRGTNGTREGQRIFNWLPGVRWYIAILAK